ncbi:uncharacterized protein LOC135199185 isoform X2 [Macrobrachium nipponense]|uniref:uncharacterized protein LOC135199185 isoform X2 n=1 Tax=Macrobrachium nipponense TaxID=159736 RepID=UPI0030C7E1F9
MECVHLRHGMGERIIMKKGVVMKNVSLVAAAPGGATEAIARFLSGYDGTVTLLFKSTSKLEIFSFRERWKSCKEKFALYESATERLLFDC